MIISSPLPRTAPILVGRDREVAKLEVLLAEGGVLALVGEGGIGKSRLARHAVGICEPTGLRTLRGNATALDGDLPLAALRDALRSHLRSQPDTTRASDPLAAAFPRMVLPELREGSDDVPGRDVVFEAAARWVAATAQPSGLLLVLEDLHWADSSTHALILHLARARAAARAAARVAVLLTFRPDEAEPDPPWTSCDANWRASGWQIGEPPAARRDRGGLAVAGHRRCGIGVLVGGALRADRRGQSLRHRGATARGHRGGASRTRGWRLEGAAGPEPPVDGQ